MIEFNFTNSTGEFKDGDSFLVNLTLTFITDNAFRSSPRSDPAVDWGFYKECQCTGVYEGCSDCRVAKANDGSGAECSCLSAHISDTVPDLVY